MQALFITTTTSDCLNHVNAWNSFAAVPAVHTTFELHGVRNCWKHLKVAEEVQPDIIFYIGASKAQGNPSADTLRRLRKFAPTVLLCCDAMDYPWHQVLCVYRTKECFDLMVAIDGAKEITGLGPIYSTLTPVDPRPFDRRTDRGRIVKCGFSGSVGRWNARSEVILALKWFGGLTVRERAGAGTYQDHAAFMGRCQMLLNISYTGTQQSHHIKGRVLEAGWAGCALLENVESPIANWFPPDCWIPYRDPPDAARIIAETSRERIKEVAHNLSDYVRRNYRPEMIYGGILEEVKNAGRSKAA